MRKISKKDREDAITLCLLRADHWIRNPDHWDAFMEFSSVGASSTSIRLFWDAFAIAGSALGTYSTMADDYLEAAALLRDGWCPGDRVRRLAK